jgi:DNA-binding IclR family transcriptional regulator
LARRSRSEVEASSLKIDAVTEEASGLARGIEIMRMLSASQQVLSVTRVAQQLGCQNAMAERLLRTLAGYRMLRVLDDGASYAPDVGVLLLGRAAAESVRAVSLAPGIFSSATLEPGLIVRLDALDRNFSVCLTMSGPMESRRIGQLRDLATCAAGHAMLWRSPMNFRAAVFELLESQGSAGAVMLGAIYRSFQQLEEKGYCQLPPEQDDPRLRCAASVRGVEDHPIMAVELSLADESGQGPQRAPGLGSLVVDLAARLRQSLGA